MAAGGAGGGDGSGKNGDAAAAEGLAERAGDKVRRLSGGQMRRVGPGARAKGIPPSGMLSQLAITILLPAGVNSTVITHLTFVIQFFMIASIKHAVAKMNDALGEARGGAAANGR